MSTLWQDIRYASRRLSQAPSFSIVVILIVALAVGANTAIFNALDQITLRPLPVKKSRELVAVHYRWRTEGGQSGTDGIFNYPVYDAYRSQTDVFSGLAAFSEYDMRFRDGSEVERIQGLVVSGNYFSVLGVVPSLGRIFSAEEEPDTAMHPVVIISDRFKQQRYGDIPDVIGQQVVIDDQSLTIVGVTPAGFTGSVVGFVPDVYIPLGTYVGMLGENIHRDNWTWLYLLGRLQPGISREQAEASLRAVNESLQASGLANVGNDALVVDGSRGWIAWDARGFDRPLALFMIVAAFILVIASFNIANMQLSRAVTRQKEIAIRQALGAGRWRIVRQLLVESLLLAGVGGICGLALAVWLDRIICVMISRIGAISMVPGLDLRVLLFAFGISLLTALVFGLVPALQVASRNVTPALKELGGIVNLPLGRWNPHHLLVAAQIAIAVIVMVCAALFVRSVVVLNGIDPGYDTTKVLAVSLRKNWLLSNRPDLRQFSEDLQERVKGLPGVETTCLASTVPLGEAGSMCAALYRDGVEIPENERSSWWYATVSPEYFRTLNMPLLAGRLLSDQDGPQAPRVMVINDVMARTYWPGQNPVGRYVTFRGREENPTVQVVGVVRASKMRSLIEGERPIAYWPLAQNARLTPVLLVRTGADPRRLIPMVRREVAALGADEVYDISTISDRVAERLFPQRAMAVILNTFSLVGLLLCVTGIYGVTARAVRQQTREIGIRMTLGAEGRHVIGAILRSGLFVTLTGIGVGLASSFAVLRLLESFVPSLRQWNKFCLFGIDVWDPLVLATMPLCVLITAVAACYLPARRAAKVDPMEALRCE